MGTAPKPGDSQLHFWQSMSRSSTWTTQLDLHTLWFLGYAVFLLCTMVLIIKAWIVRSLLIPTTIFYRLAVGSLASSMALVIYRTIPANADTLMKFMVSESAPYLVLSIVMFLRPALPVLLTPFIIYAIYHVLSFLQGMPKVQKHAYWINYGRPLATALQAHQLTALNMAAHLEIFGLPYLLFRFIRSGEHLLTLIIYVQFLRWQYIVSPKTHAACLQWNATIKKVVANPSCPRFIKNAERWLRAKICKLGEYGPAFPARPSSPTTSGAGAIPANGNPVRQRNQ